MKATSSVVPSFLVSSEGKMYVNCNVVQTVVPGQDSFPDRTEYVYDTVEVLSTSRNDLISAVMQARYSKDKEISLLNNYIVSGTTEAWEEYQAYRAYAKQLVDTSIV